MPDQTSPLRKRLSNLNKKLRGRQPKLPLDPLIKLAEQSQEKAAQALPVPTQMPGLSRDPAIEQAMRSLDAGSRTKFQDIPSYVMQWTTPWGGIKGKRLLDFGCGSGLSAAGAAILGEADLVVGVDINPESRACQTFLDQHFGIPNLPPNLHFEEITPGQTTSHDNFDCIFSWSVFEHVDERIFADVLTGLTAKLRPGGLFFVQISPLYFSPEGSHLWTLGFTAWQHLVYQTANVEADITTAPHLSAAEKAALLGMYRTLNRITADDLIERFTDAGLTLLRQQRDVTHLTPPVALTRAYATEALTTYQIVALFQKPL